MLLKKLGSTLQIYNGAFLCVLAYKFMNSGNPDSNLCAPCISEKLVENIIIYILKIKL